LVAFFFIVAFSFGLDLAAALPGFRLTGIRIPPVGSLLGDERKALANSSPLNGIIETRYALIKTFADHLDRNFKAGEKQADARLSRIRMPFSHKRGLNHQSLKA
jgi:hypothetical protein